MKRAVVLSTGAYLPKRCVTNRDLESMVDTTHEWIMERTGIERRHIAADNEDAVSMAEIAANRALEAAGLTANDIDMIIVSTTTPTLVFPGTACLLQQRLKISGCAAFDLNASACAGFMYAFSIADQYIRAGTYKNILVIGSEVMSRIIDWSDRTICVLFGDGAGAVILSQSDQPGVLSTHLHADGNYKDVLYLKQANRKEPQFENIKMQGNSLFKLAVNTLGNLFDETLAANQLPKSAIDWLVPHQANLRIIDAMARKLELAHDRVTVTLAEQGNTSSASIPLALDQAIRDGRIKRGQILMMEGFGGGLAWGSALVKY